MSSLTGYLSFDPTDTGSIDASASMGSFTRSGKSGALITNHNSIENPGISFVFVDGDISANVITEAAHGLDTGDIVRFTTSGTLPTGLALLTDYYVIRVSANSFSVASSPQNAELGVAVAITADGSGNHTLTSQDAAVKSLDVNVVNTVPVSVGGSVAVTATDLDIRDLVFATDKVDVSGSSVSISGTVAVTQSTSPWTVDGTVELGATSLAALETIELGATTLAALENITVSATDLDIRDLSHLAGKDSVQIGDGTSLITSTLVSGKQALDVNIANSIDIDDDLANTAIENTATAVSTSAVNVVSSALANRKFLAIASNANKIIYFGKTGVTTSNGFPLYMREKAMFRIGAAVTPQFIGESGSSSEDMRVMELS